MPRGPNGEWRPVGDNECAALVSKILLGESPEVYEPPDCTEEERRERRRRASKGGHARAAGMSEDSRSEIAAMGAAARVRATKRRG